MREAAAPPAAAVTRWRGTVPGTEAPAWVDAGLEAVGVAVGRVGPRVAASGWVEVAAETLLVVLLRVGAEGPGSAWPGAELVRVVLARVEAGAEAGAEGRLMARLTAAKVPRWGRPGLEGPRRAGAARAVA